MFSTATATPPRERVGLAAVVATLVLVAGLLVIGRADAAPAQDLAFDAAEEATYVVEINAIRAANGLGPLQVDPNMTAAAREWTAWMVETTTLAHADDIVTGAPQDWLKVGENVGRGGTLDAVWEAFLASPSHAANVLDPEYDLVGIGVLWTADGRHYTTHRFASTESAGDPAPVQPAPEPTPEPTPESLPEPAPDTDGTDGTVPPDQLPFDDEGDTDETAPTEPATGEAVDDRAELDRRRLETTVRLLLDAG